MRLQLGAQVLEREPGGLELALARLSVILDRVDHAHRGPVGQHVGVEASEQYLGIRAALRGIQHVVERRPDRDLEEREGDRPGEVQREPRPPALAADGELPHHPVEGWGEHPAGEPVAERVRQQDAPGDGAVGVGAPRGVLGGGHEAQDDPDGGAEEPEATRALGEWHVETERSTRGMVAQREWRDLASR